MKKQRFRALKLLLITCLLAVPLSAQATTASFEPTKDTYLDQGLPDSSYGSIGLGTVSFQPAGNLLRIMMLQFDISSIPAGSTITSATLNLRLGGCIAGGSTGSMTVGAYMNGTAAPWSESSTYNSITDRGGSYEPIGTAAISCSPGSYNPVNVTDVVSKWVDGTIPNDGLALVPVQTGSTYWTRVFYMSEAAASSRPTLSISYEVPYEEVATPDGGPIASTEITSSTNTATATTVPQPLVIDTTLAAPQQLVVSQKENPVSVNLSWKKSSTEGVEAYAIYRKKGSGAYQQIARATADTLTYTDKDVQRGQTYSYLIRSVRSAKESESSPVATIKVVAQKTAVAAAKTPVDYRLLVAWSLVAVLIIAGGSYAYYRLHRKHKTLVRKHAKPKASTKS